MYLNVEGSSKKDYALLVDFNETLFCVHEASTLLVSQFRNIFSESAQLAVE